MADQNILIKFSADTSELNKAISTTENQLDNLASEAGSAANATQKLQGGVDALKDSTTKYTKENRFLRDSMEDVIAATTGMTQEQAKALLGAGRLATGLKAVGGATTTLTRALVAMASVLTVGIAVAILLVVKNFDKLKLSVTNFTDKLGLSVAQQERAVIAAKKLKETTETQIKLYEAEAKRLELLGYAKDAVLKAELKGAELRLKTLKIEYEATEALEKAQAAAANKRIERLSYLGVLINAILPKRKTSQTDKEKKEAEELKVEIYEAENAIISINETLKDYYAGLNAVTAAKTKTKTATDEAAKSVETLSERLLRLRGIIRDIAGGGETGQAMETLIGRIERLREASDASNKDVFGGDRTPGRVGRTSKGDTSTLPRDKRIEQEKEYISYLVESLQFVNDLTAMIANARSAKIQGEIDDLNKLKDAELENAELTARQKERIEERYAKKVGELKTKQAKAERRAAISQALVNGALAITNIISTAKPITWPFLLAIAGATIAAQVATIAATPLPKYRKGGAVEGKRHESGGVHIEAEGGEWIHNREAVAYYGKDFMKDINEMRIPKSVLMPDLPAAVIAGAVSHGIDHERLGKTIGRELAKQPKVSIALDERGFTKHISDGSTRTRYANRKFNAA